MGEHVVLATGVDVESLAEVLERHRRALEVPAREALAPAAVPAELTALAGRPPEREVGMVALVRLELAAVARPQLVQRVAGQRAVAGERRDLVVQVAGGGEVGVAEVLESLGEREHLRDVLRGARELVGRQEVDQRGVGVEGGLVGVRDLAGAAALEAGRNEHRVLLAPSRVGPQVADVRDVLDMEDLDAVVQHGAPDQVGEQERAEIADVGVPVDGRAARVHAQPAGLDRLDGHDRPRQRVPESEGHAVSGRDLRKSRRRA